MKGPVFKIIFGAGMVLIGLVSPFAFFILMMLGGGSEAFLVPGTLSLSISEPGTYYLWNDYSTFFNNRAYNNPKELPNGLELALVNVESKAKQELHVGSPIQSQNGSDKSVSIGYFQLEPGTYELKVLGNFPEQVMSFGRWKLDGMFWKIIGIGICAASICIVGLVLIVRAIVQLSNSSSNRRPGF